MPSVTLNFDYKAVLAGAAVLFAVVSAFLGGRQTGMKVADERMEMLLDYQKRVVRMDSMLNAYRMENLALKVYMDRRRNQYDTLVKRYEGRVGDLEADMKNFPKLDPKLYQKYYDGL